MTTHGDGASAINRAIGSRVNWYLKYAGDRHTQTELGRVLGLDQSAVSKKLLGERPFFLPEIYAIAQWLDRPLNDFLPSPEDLTAAPPMPAPRPPRTRRRAVASAGRDAAVKSQVKPGISARYHGATRLRVSASRSRSVAVQSPLVAQVA